MPIEGGFVKGVIPPEGGSDFLCPHRSASLGRISVNMPRHPLPCSAFDRIQYSHKMTGCRLSCISGVQINLVAVTQVNLAQFNLIGPLNQAVVPVCPLELFWFRRIWLQLC